MHLEGGMYPHFVPGPRLVDTAKDFGFTNGIASGRGWHQVTKQAYHQITCRCNRKTHTILTSISNFDFVPHTYQKKIRNSLSLTRYLRNNFNIYSNARG